MNASYKPMGPCNLWHAWSRTAHQYNLYYHFMSFVENIIAKILIPKRKLSDKASKSHLKWNAWGLIALLSSCTLQTLCFIIHLPPKISYFFEHVAVWSIQLNSKLSDTLLSNSTMSVDYLKVTLWAEGNLQSHQISPT